MMGLFKRLFGRTSRAEAATFTDPVSLWQQPFQRACERMSALEFEEALTLLAPMVGKVRGFTGGQAELIQGMTLGRMATCHLESGRAEAAIPLYQEAAELSRKARDEESLISWLSNLFEAHRYLGQSEDAAEVALECARELERLGKRGRSRRFRKVADIVRRGEPACRVVLTIDGTFFEADELPSIVEGNLDFIFFRNRMFLARATALLDRGRALVAEGCFEEALPLFREAGRIDAYSPVPPYEEAITLLHLQRASEAVACYDTVEALAPGWFHCRADRWLAAELAAGRIPHSAFPLLRILETTDPRAPEYKQIALQGIREAPGAPAFHLYLGIHLSALGQNEEARAAFSEGLRQTAEPDLRSRLLVQVALLEPPSPEREQKLQEAMAPGGNLVAALMAALLPRMPPGRSESH